MLFLIGTGKTTFIRMLAGRLTPDDKSNVYILINMCLKVTLFFIYYDYIQLPSFTGEVPVLNVSYKPQKISPKSTVSVFCFTH